MNNRLKTGFSRQRHHQSGVTLLELLIAAAIGLIVIAGVTDMLSHSVKTNNILKAQTEIQETIGYTDNRLAFIFKQAMSSPCGSLDEMFAGNVGQTSKIKKATISGAPQPNLNKFLMQVSGADANDENITRAQFPMIISGIEGSAKESKSASGKPISESLNGIIKGTEYLIVTEISEKISINSTAINGIEGGRSIGGLMEAENLTAIPTSNIGMDIGTTQIPFIITDCDKADLFLPTGNVTATQIPIDNNLAFHATYRPKEAIISPIRVYGYYIAESDGIPYLSRKDLTANTARQSLVAGVSSLSFEWGLGDPANNSVQSYFSTTDLSQLPNFRRYLISVRVNMTVNAANNNNARVLAAAETVTTEGEDGNTTEVKTTKLVQEELQAEVSRVFTLRNKMSQ